MTDTSLYPPPPGPLQGIAAAIGVAALLRLLEQRGGTVVYVPGRSLSPNSGLGKELGLDDEACERLRGLLSSDTAGERVKIPLARAWRARVYRLDGLSYTQIALRLGVTERAVWGILSAADMTHNQLALPL